MGITEKNIIETFFVISSQRKIIKEVTEPISKSTLMSPVPLPSNFKDNFEELRDGGKRHSGIDIPVKSGTPVKSPLDGIVTFVASDQYPCGGTIDISYGDGWMSRFCHMKKIDVKKGDIVEKGQVVGLSGGGMNDYGKGRTTGPHLHFALLKDKKRVNPADYIDKTLDISYSPDYDVSKKEIDLDTDVPNSEKTTDKVLGKDLFLKYFKALAQNIGK